MFQDKNNVIIIGLVLLLIGFVYMRKENFENTHDELINISGNFKEICTDIVYADKKVSAQCPSRDNSKVLDKSFYFINPCRVLNYNQNREELVCHSQV